MTARMFLLSMTVVAGCARPLPRIAPPKEVSAPLLNVVPIVFPVTNYWPVRWPDEATNCSTFWVEGSLDMINWTVIPSERVGDDLFITDTNFTFYRVGAAP